MRRSVLKVATSCRISDDPVSDRDSADWYSDTYYDESPSRKPKGPATGLARVVRGGSWDSRPTVLSGSVRNWGHRGYREGDFGFRCAMDVPE